MEKTHAGAAASCTAALSACMIEACWLAGVALVPLLFDPRAAMPFQPLKTVVTQMLGAFAAVVLLGQAGGFIRKQGWGAAGRAVKRARWALPIAALAAAWGLASVFSVDPGSSLWGSPEFRQGVFTMGAQLLLFIGVATNFRRREQAERLVATALAASVPVCIYAFLQRTGWDPLLFDSYTAGAFSFAGQPIFLAGYLLMLMPLAVWKVWDSFGASPQSRTWVKSKCALDGTILLLLLAAFVAAEKRGPMVAFAAAGVSALALLAAYRRQVRLAQWALRILAAVAVALTALALAGKSHPGWQQMPVLGRLSLIVPVGERTGDQFRHRVWNAAPALVAARRPFIFPDETVDSWTWLRPLLGYGPETLGAVLPQSLMMQDDPDQKIESRFHNHFWDTWQSIGLGGLAALLWLYIRVFSGSCRVVGVAGSEHPKIGAAIISLSLGGMGALTTCWLYGFGFGGMGFQLGFAAGLVMWALRVGLGSADAVPPRTDPRRDLLVIALLVALLGNWVDLAFVFPTGNTSILFWIFLGAAGGLNKPAEPPNAAAPRASTPSPSSWAAAGLFAAVISGSMLVALLHAFVNRLSFTPMTFGAVLETSLQQLRVDQGPSHLLALLFFPTWVTANFGLLAAMNSERRNGHFLKSAALAGGLSLTMAIGFALAKAQWIAHLGPIPPPAAAASVAVAQSLGFAKLGMGFLALLAAGVAAAGWSLFRFENRSPRPAFGFLTIAATAGLTAVACVALEFTGFRSMRQEAVGGWGRVLETFDRKIQAVEVYAGALTLDPRAFHLRLPAAIALEESDEQAGGNADASPALERAAQLLESGRAFGELNVINLHLGRLYLRWALRTQDAELATSRAILARAALRRALVFAPDTEVALVDSALVDQLFQGDLRAAEEKLARADEITLGTWTDAWGKFYARQSFAASEARLKKTYARRGIAYFKRALEPDSAKVAGPKISPDHIYEALVTQGTLHRNLGESDLALACFLRAAGLEGPVIAWQAEAMLAETYLDLHDRARAAQHLQKALTTAPTDVQAGLMDLQRRLSRPNAFP